MVGVGRSVPTNGVGKVCAGVWPPLGAVATHPLIIDKVMIAAHALIHRKVMMRNRSLDNKDGQVQRLPVVSSAVVLAMQSERCD